MSDLSIFSGTSRALLITLFLCSSCAWNKGELLKWFSKKESTDNSQLKKVGAKEEELAKSQQRKSVSHENNVWLIRQTVNGWD
jgi:hypothetical protein